jgi:4-hydroxy-2-oxoheptanedioate aldolase
MSAAKRKLAAGGAVLSVNPGGANLTAVDMIARYGADVVFIDAERSVMGIESVHAMARTAQAHGLAAVVRTPSREPGEWVRYFDCGIDGLVLPQVEQASDCARLVETARYATKGREAELLLIAQIESTGGVAQLDAIAGSAGIDLVLVGPNDLAHSMGYLGDTSQPAVVAEVAQVTQRLHSLGMPYGLPVTTQTVREWRARGARFLFTTLDQHLGVGIKALQGELA